MENASRALEIAAGVLVAMMIVAIGTYLFQNIRRMEMVRDDAVAMENQAEFNQTWLAYNKNLMYGTDVLSCLNKAQNNNQRYVYNNYYGTDGSNISAGIRAEYFVDVTVTLKSTLKENIIAYYRDSAGVSRKIVGINWSGNNTIGGATYTAAQLKTNYSKKIFKRSGTESEDYYFKLPTVYYYYFKNGKLYQQQRSYADAMWSTNMSNWELWRFLQNADSLNTKFTADREYHLLHVEDVVAASDEVRSHYTTSTSDQDNSAELSALLSTVNLMEGVIINKNPVNSGDMSQWYSAIWKTAAYDFKTRKFKCTEMHYNEVTGYIDRISFVELADSDLYN